MQPPSRELFSFENMDMSYDWSEIQDLVLDFDGMENVSNINWDNILADRQSDDPAATPRPPAKAMRLRLYRRFGPTAVLPGLRKLSIAVNTRSPEGSGLWMLSGMAIRMAQDMGLHRRPEKEANPSSVAFWDRSPLSPDGKGLLSDEMSKLHQAKSKLILFWTVFFLDVFVSLLTGRPPTLKRSEVEVPIPTTDDMKAAQLDFQEHVSMKNKIFPEIARFMLLYSEAVELLNQTRSEEQADVSTSSNESSQRSKLEKVRDQIMNLYHSLPPDLAFSIDNYKAASLCRQAGQFLMLHVYFYTFTILLSRKHSPERTSNSPQPQAVLVACQKIVQMLNTAELIDKTGYLSVPFINQGLFVAASTILEEQQSNQNRPQDLFSLVSSTDVEYLCKKLQEMSHYFRGTGVTLAALERKRREVAAKTTRGNHSSEDEDSDEEKNEVVQLSDGGIVNRYSIPEEGS
ncbi:putative transcriptional regulatory protein [Colletotrichum sp. SAR11_57]|nr:putative transcriptional regulatory protein [Colletotrichum sp. SAR11_57]